MGGKSGTSTGAKGHGGASRWCGSPNVLSFDLEDWSYLVMRRFGREPIPHPDEVEGQTDRVLGLLSRRGIRATFFVLGRTAASVPALVRRIAREGHEVATHGYDHEPIAGGDMDAFAEDLRRAKAELEDLLGEEVIGYRAPAFSVPGDRRQAFFDVLARTGIRYDSSVVPVAMSRYGIGGFGLAPCRVPTAAGGEVLEFPLSLVPWAGRLWMVAGGGYWRLFPAWLLRRAVRKVRADGRPLVTYLHNYEFDARALRVRRMRARPRELRTWEIRSNLFRRTIPRKLVQLLSEFPFAPFRDVLARVGPADRTGAAPGESDDG